MQKLKLKKIITISVLSVLLLPASHASASFDALNNGTGFNSLNNASALINDNFADLNQNTDVTVNNAGGVITSGGNLILNNNSEGGAETGDVALAGGLANDANSNVLDYQGSWLADPIIGNQTTGANSINTATGLLNSNFGVVNTNFDRLANNIFAQGVTGGNAVQFNGGPGLVNTGNAVGSLDVDNAVNANYLRAISAESAGLLNTALNSCTGAGSINNANLEVRNAIGVVNTNIADIDNNVFATLSTGGNLIMGNGGCGCGICGACGPETVVATGNAVNQTSITNAANSNATLINANFGALQVAAHNSSTGAGSLNYANAELETNVGVVNTNVADIDNNVATTALTGGNIVANNGGFATLATGDAANAVNIQNGPININSTNIAVGGAGQVAAVNEATGFGSVNCANAELETNVGVVNTNVADIDNNVATTALTGGNVVTGNSGGCGCNVCPCGGETAVITGDTANQTTIANTVNVTQTTVVVPAPVEVVVENSCTGADSINSANAEVIQNVSIVNTNDAEITNNVYSTSSSGGNVVTGNTGGGLVSTGDAALAIGVINDSNSNSTTVSQ